MSDIFISYNNKDRPRVQTIVQALDGRGWSIFWYQTIPYGKTWRETIGKELSEARCVVVLWSKNSIELDWVREEADEAKARRVLVPVRIDDVQPPIGFRGLQTADLVHWNATTKATYAFDRLIADIAGRIGSAPLKAPPKTREAPAPAQGPQPTHPELDIQQKHNVNYSRVLGRAFLPQSPQLFSCFYRVHQNSAWTGAPYCFSEG